ncbi:MAG TPA: molybdenum cofactor guanylyltransferase, partial [Rhodothermales bacterium]|nr:molybdenum cofactor guanylyltransferase [Rhodothermales bacterium]
PLVARVFAALAPHSAEVLIATGSTPRDYPVGARVVLDAAPDAGPLGGLVAGLTAARTPWLLVAACDLAYLTPAALVPLLAADTGDADAVVALDGEGWAQPVCALYHTRIATVAADHLAAGQFALYRLLDRLTVVGVPLDADALRNANTPADLGARSLATPSPAARATPDSAPTP